MGGVVKGGLMTDPNEIVRAIEAGTTAIARLGWILCGCSVLIYIALVWVKNEIRKARQ